MKIKKKGKIGCGVPDGCLTPRQTGRLTVGRNISLTLTLETSDRQSQGRKECCSHTLWWQHFTGLAFMQAFTKKWLSLYKPIIVTKVTHRRTSKNRGGVEESVVPLRTRPTIQRKPPSKPIEQETHRSYRHATFLRLWGQLVWSSTPLRTMWDP
jgi:hypothetical protein